MNIDLRTAIDVRPRLGKAKQRIYRIGIELEGAWAKRPPGPGNVGHDGSVTGLQDEYAARQLLVGELPSPPLAVAKKDAVAELLWSEWLKVNYPQKINQSCGMHVHLRPKTSFNYQRLMEMSYPATIIAEVTAWAKEHGLAKDHPIWPRLAGKSRFCKFQFFPNEQSCTNHKDFDQERHGHRYTVINYCWSRYGTAELRLLPMMQTPEEAESVIQHFLNVTDAFLLTTAKREQREVAAYHGDLKAGIDSELRVVV